MLRTGIMLAALVLAACESTPERNYWDLMKEPIPESDSERDQECAKLRSEVARMQSAAQYAAVNTPPQWALFWQAKARDDIAALNSRYSQIQCDVVRIKDESRMSFDACFAKCREITDRTESQCFDACK